MPTETGIPIPAQFLERMRRYLEDEFPAFAAELDKAPRSGLRVNTLKLSPEDFKAIAPFALGERVAWCPSAFNLPSPTGRGGEGEGKHPYHLAGLYYLQDPSAMASAELLMDSNDPGGRYPAPTRVADTGMRVLDLAAAPGGKTTHLAALMNGGGVLVANEIKDKRVGHLAMNVERWGAGNVVVTNETPERLADHFGPIFDRVLVDAPCSGEGMFRKDMGARADWSMEMVAGCAVRQKNILRVAAKLVRPGGGMLYSTCTFAPEEDEGVIASFLDERADFEVAALPQLAGFMSGRPDWLVSATERTEKNQRSSVLSAVSHRRAAVVRGTNGVGSVLKASLHGAVRLFPHRIDGEGHFACLLRRREGDTEVELRPARLARMTKAQSALWEKFVHAVLAVEIDVDRLRVVRERLYLVPESLPELGRVRVVHPGLWLGTFKKERFEPAHPLALYLRRDQAANVLSLNSEGIVIGAYLRGETLASAGPPGWVLVTVDGFPIGWGKRVGAVVKNHYPRGWMLGRGAARPSDYDK